MKAVNKQAKKVLDYLRDHMEDGHLKISNSPAFMPVYFEQVGGEIYSMAHYGECNGDLMADPEMEILYRGGEWYPISFCNHYAGSYRIAVTFKSDGSIESVDLREQAGATDFMNIWVRNICEQQQLKI
jgi:hypothetical protein